MVLTKKDALGVLFLYLSGSDFEGHTLEGYEHGEPSVPFYEKGGTVKRVTDFLQKKSEQA
ncbi:MAG: hypothetical protein E7402_04205 [Ruminococcaceae bacterium]|nr:hypothetical protein [Oscillospiraceae bacterium]